MASKIIDIGDMSHSYFDSFSDEDDDLPPWTDPIPSFKVNIELIMGYLRNMEKQRNSSSELQCDIAETSKIIFLFYPNFAKIEKYKESAYELSENGTIISGKEEKSKSHYFVYSGNGYCEGIHFWSVKMHANHLLDKIGVHTICDTNWQSVAPYGWPQTIGYNLTEVHPDSYSCVKASDWWYLGKTMTIELNCNEWSVKYYADEKINDNEFELQLIRKHKIKSNETYYFAMSISSKKHASCYEVMEIPTQFFENAQIKEHEFYQEFGRMCGTPVTIPHSELLKFNFSD